VEEILKVFTAAGKSAGERDGGEGGGGEITFYPGARGA
jgi:hypothetical protein